MGFGDSRAYNDWNTGKVTETWENLHSLANAKRKNKYKMIKSSEVIKSVMRLKQWMIRVKLKHKRWVSAGELEKPPVPQCWQLEIVSVK